MVITFYQRIRQFPRQFYFLLISLATNRIAYFATMPFLAIYLQHHAHFSLGLIGTVMAASPLAYALSGIYGGFLADKFGSRHLFIWSMFLGGLAILILLSVLNPWWIFLWYAIFGMTRSVFDNTSKSVSIHLVGAEQRRLAFSFRFIMINFGAAIGPLIGAEFAAKQSASIFTYAAVVFFILGFIFARQQWKTDPVKKTSLSFKEVITVLKRDKILRLITLVSIIFWTIYTQFDVSIPQYLYAHFKNGTHIFAMIFIVNTILCMTLQIPITEWMPKIKPLSVVIISAILMAMGFVMMSVAKNGALFIGATVFITLSEIMMITLIDIFVADLSPKHLLATYLGASSMGMLGVALGPFLGGWISEFGSFEWVCLFCILLCVSYAVLFAFMMQMKAKILPSITANTLSN